MKKKYLYIMIPLFVITCVFFILDIDLKNDKYGKYGKRDDSNFDILIFNGNAYVLDKEILISDKMYVTIYGDMEYDDNYSIVPK